MEKEKKKDIIEAFAISEGDTGSAEAQIALLTYRITRLTEHMQTNRHDYSSQRGLLKLVGQRRKLLTYLSKEDVKRYHRLISRLGLRK